jgi:cyclohexanecarboxylate-CoA ligase
VGRPAVIRATRPSPVDWTAAGWYQGRTAASHLDDCAAKIPHQLAVVEGDMRLTYAELASAASRVAGGLRARGIAQGDVATMQMPNWWESTVAFQALTRLGCVVNPVVPIYREHEMGFIVDQARPAVIVIPHRFRGFDYVAMYDGLLSAGDRPRPLVVVIRPDGPLPDGFVGLDDLPASESTVEAVGTSSDISLLLYTSGTTADPKGVLHSHDTLQYEVQSIIDLCALTADDLVFMPSPVTHITGFLYAFLLPPVLGTSTALLDVWDPVAAVDLVEREGCRFTVAATPFLHGMVEEHAKRGVGSPLRSFLCGGADVPPALVRRASEVMGGHIARVYGSSEFPTFCCGRPTDGPEVCADTDGVPIGPVECRLDNEVDGVGELLVKGPDLFLGYLDPALNAASFTEDGYFRTGDLASLDERGAVTIRGRQKDIIVRGGENISAKEVEDILYGHPSIAEVAVVAMPDPVMVERACAFVVPVEGATVTLEDLTAFLSEQRIARQKHPERIELIDALPMTASGKVQKFVLRDQVRQRLAAER